MRQYQQLTTYLPIAISLFLNLALPLTSQGQETLELSHPKHLFRYSKLEIGLSPSALTNIVPGIQVSIDKGVYTAPLINFTLEMAYLFQYEDFNYYLTPSYRIKAGAEYMIYRYEHGTIASGIYFLRRSTTNIAEFTKKNYQLNFTKVEEYTHRETIQGALLGSSLRVQMPNNSRFSIEFGGAIGLGILSVRNSKSFSVPFFFYEWVIPKRYDAITPLVSLNFNISYRLLSYAPKQHKKKRKRRKRRRRRR